jgi:hypothetical protein
VRDVSRAPVALLFAAVLFAAPATFAHHSFAAYESVKTLTLTGTVETFEWADPHVALHVLAQENAGDEPVEWDIETSGPGILKLFGWKGGIRSSAATASWSC